MAPELGVTVATACAAGVVTGHTGRCVYLGPMRLQRKSAATLEHLPVEITSAGQGR